MIVKDGQQGIRFYREWKSVAEFLAVQASKVNVERNANEVGKLTGKTEDDEKKWRGGLSTVEEVRSFISAGWREGTKKMKETIGRLTAPTVKSVKRRAVWRDEGDEIEIGRVYSGDLDHAWRGMERRLVDGQGAPYVRLWVSATMVCTRKAEEFFWRGAAACILADALEEAGYRVEIVSFEQTSGTYTDSPTSKAVGGLDELFIIPLKGFDEALDVERVAATTAHASWLRVAYFMAKYSMDAHADYGLGHPEHHRPVMAEDNDIVVDNLWNVEDTKRFLATELAKFGTDE